MSHLSSRSVFYLPATNIENQKYSENWIPNQYVPRTSESPEALRVKYASIKFKTLVAVNEAGSPQESFGVKSVHEIRYFNDDSINHVFMRKRSCLRLECCALYSQECTQKILTGPTYKAALQVVELAIDDGRVGTSQFVIFALIYFL